MCALGRPARNKKRTPRRGVPTNDAEDGGLVGGGIGGGGGFFDGGVEVVEGFHGFGIVFDLVVESFESEVGGVFGDEVEAFGGEGGLVDAGPGVGETGEVGGIGIVAFGHFAEGIEQEGK